VALDPFKRIKADPTLPVLGGIQPTHGQMAETLRAGLKHARELREWFSELPSGLLIRVTVPMSTPPRSDEPASPLGVVIGRLAHTLEELVAQHDADTVPGQQAGRRIQAQFAACWLFWFMNRYAPGAPIEARRAFVFRGMRGLGIDCPDMKKRVRVILTRGSLKLKHAPNRNQSLPTRSNRSLAAETAIIDKTFTNVYNWLERHEEIPHITNGRTQLVDSNPQLSPVARQGGRPTPMAKEARNRALLRDCLDEPERDTC
jgi:hypothetical protein